MLALCNAYPLHVTCKICAEDHTIMVNSEDIISWQCGDSLDECMDYLNDDEKYMLTNSVCGNCK